MWAIEARGRLRKSRSLSLEQAPFRWNAPELHSPAKTRLTAGPDLCSSRATLAAAGVFGASWLLREAGLQVASCQDAQTAASSSRWDRGVAKHFGTSDILRLSKSIDA